jgi:Tfp pilus assembly protein PilF
MRFMLDPTGSLGGLTYKRKNDLFLKRVASAQAHAQHWLRTLFEIGTLYRDLGHTSQAEKVYKQAVAVGLKPTAATNLSGEDKKFLAKTFVNLGVGSYESKDKAGAIEYFKKAVQVDPTHETASKNLMALGYTVKVAGA